MITIRPFHSPRTDWVRRPTDQQWVKWVEKPISSLSSEPVTQAKPTTGTTEQWLHDHYTWVIEEVKV